MIGDQDVEAIRIHRSVQQQLKLGKVEAATTACGVLTSRWPAFAPGWLVAADLALRRGDTPGARAALERACRVSLHDASVQHTLGSLFSAMGLYHEALTAASRAVELDGSQATYHFNRGAILRFLGRIDEAEAAYDLAIELNPGDHEAWLNRSELRTQSEARNHITALKMQVAKGFSHPRNETFIRFALAKELEDVGHYAESFMHLHAGASIRRRYIDYDLERDLRTVDLIVDAFPVERFAGLIPTSAARSPIFVVGLPRTGTTLVERILGSHPQVQGAGELLAFPQALVAAVEQSAGRTGVAREEMIRIAAGLDLLSVGADYLERARCTTGMSLRFVDKLPHNYLYCGLIHEAIPGARIVHVERHPMATCHAMYKTLFRQGYPFSYDQEEIARFYVAYRHLMQHWNNALQGIVHTVSYEALVGSQRSTTRDLLEFCELDWHEGCLDFHTNPAATTTASATQVRRPLYSSSVELWKHYRRELAPLEERLRACGIEIGD